MPDSNRPDTTATLLSRTIGDERVGQYDRATFEAALARQFDAWWPAAGVGTARHRCVASRGTPLREVA